MTALPDLPRPVQEGLATVAVWRALGYAEKEVHMAAVERDGESGAIAGVLCTLVYDRPNVGGVRYTRGFAASDLTFAEVTKAVEAATRAWNGGEDGERNEVLMTSWAVANRMLMVSEMVMAGFPGLGPLAKPVEADEPAVPPRAVTEVPEA